MMVIYSGFNMIISVAGYVCQMFTVVSAIWLFVFNSDTWSDTWGPFTNMD